MYVPAGMGTISNLTSEPGIVSVYGFISACVEAETVKTSGAEEAQSKATKQIIDKTMKSKR